MRLEKYFREETVSTEGFSDILSSVKKFFAKGKPKPGKRGDGKKRDYFLQELKSYDQDFKEQLTQLEKALQTTYADKKWLSKQEFVTGDIKATDITSRFVIDGKVQTDFIKAIEANERNLAKLYGGVRSACIAYGAQITGIDKALCSKVRRLDPDNTDDVRKVDALLEEALTTIANIKNNPKTAYGQAATYYLPNLKLQIDDKYGVSFVETKAAVDTVPALTEEGVYRHATVILQIIDRLRHYSGLNWYLGGSTEDDGETLRDFYDVTDMDDYYDATYYQNLMDWDPYQLQNGLVEVILALEKLLDRSVK